MNTTPADPIPPVDDERAAETRDRAEAKPTTTGWSPKVVNPMIGLLVAGILLVVLGHDQEGQALLGAALVVAGVGRRSGPGEVAR